MVADKVIEIAADVFEVDAGDIALGMTPDDISLWDSLNHLRLITAVESQFKIRLSMGQIQQIESLADVSRIVSEMFG